MTSTESSGPSGYDAAFLGRDVPLPSGGDSRVDLAYTHFTVAVDTGRRLAALTAVNIDGSSLRDVERNDDWRLDDRLPADQQAGPELYADNDLDRGHLVRRRDPVWGNADVAERANDDTFHYTVCAPQTATFNQSKELWLGLEDYILDHTRQYGQKLSVFSGSVFADDDPVYRDVPIPRRFFKIAAWADGDDLRTTGYVLDQSPSLGPIVDAERLRASDAERLRVSDTDVPPLGPYRTFQVPVSDIGGLTGLDVAQLAAGDRYLVPAGALPGEGRWTELTSLARITV